MTGLPALEATALTVRYGAKTAVDRVSLAVPPGSVYALLGRNGAGKSTFVRALLGYERPQEGRIRIFGQDAWQERTRTMLKVGTVPEVPDVPPRLTTAEAAAFCGRLHPRWDPSGVAARLARFHIDPALPFGTLSRGQQTQVALALALGSRPELLVLDDPTLGLDPVARRDLYRELLEDLAEHGTTVFMTTHDLAGIEGLADRVGIMTRGRMVLDEPLENLKARFRKLHCPPRQTEASLEALGPLTSARSAFGLEATVAAYSPEAGAAAGLDPAWVEGASLEEIFLATVTEEVLS
jgi:ABC-2 type transport system ATP-binding protein